MRASINIVRVYFILRRTNILIYPNTVLADNQNSLGKLLAKFNVSKVFKIFLGTNTLAYPTIVLTTKKKGFMRLSEFFRSIWSQLAGPKFYQINIWWIQTCHAFCQKTLDLQTFCLHDMEPLPKGRLSTVDLLDKIAKIVKRVWDSLFCKTYFQY
jgi:hypothetical protein